MSTLQKKIKGKRLLDEGEPPKRTDGDRGSQTYTTDDVTDGSCAVAIGVQHTLVLFSQR